MSLSEINVSQPGANPIKLFRPKSHEIDIEITVNTHECNVLTISATTAG